MFLLFACNKIRFFSPQGPNIVWNKIELNRIIFGDTSAAAKMNFLSVMHTYKRQI